MGHTGGCISYCPERPGGYSRESVVGSFFRFGDGASVFRLVMTETSINAVKCKHENNDKIVYGEEVDSR